MEGANSQGVAGECLLAGHQGLRLAVLLHHDVVGHQGRFILAGCTRDLTLDSRCAGIVPREYAEDRNAGHCRSLVSDTRLVRSDGVNQYGVGLVVDAVVEASVGLDWRRSSIAGFELLTGSDGCLADVLRDLLAADDCQAAADVVDELARRRRGLLGLKDLCRYRDMLAHLLLSCRQISARRPARR